MTGTCTETKEGEKIFQISDDYLYTLEEIWNDHRKSGQIL